MCFIYFNSWKTKLWILFCRNQTIEPLRWTWELHHSDSWTNHTLNLYSIQHLFMNKFQTHTQTLLMYIFKMWFQVKCLFSIFICLFLCWVIVNQLYCNRYWWKLITQNHQNWYRCDWLNYKLHWNNKAVPQKNLLTWPP